MIKLRFDFNWINKHWYFIDFKNQTLFDRYVQIVPYNNDMKDFWKYFVEYIINYNNAERYLQYFKLKCEGIDIPSHFFVCDSKAYFGEYMVFQFPDEETAFYFKLKFC